MLIVDAHIHIWNKGLPRPAHRQSPYSADQVLADMAKAQIDAAIIQPPAWDSDANQIAIAAAKLYPQRFGILGNFSLQVPNGIEVLHQWKKQSGMLGLRYILNDPLHVPFFSGTELDWLWRTAEELNIPIALASSNHLTLLEIIAKRFPKLRLIIDHLGVPLDAKGEGAFSHLPELISLSQYPNIAIKATAVPAYAIDHYPYLAIEPFVEKIFQAFGPNRFFWGSDITKLQCTWLECVELFTVQYQWLSSSDKDLVMGKALCNWLDWKISG